MSDDSFARAELVAELAAHIDVAKHRFLTELRAVHSSLEWARQGFRTCAQWMSWRLNWDLHTSREYVRTATALEKFPLIDDALRCGQISYSKVRAMTRVATPANETLLLEEAKLTTASQLAAICRKYATVVRAEQRGTTAQDDLERRQVTRRERDDGMVVIKAILHADEAERVWAALDRVGRELCHSVDDDSSTPVPAVTSSTSTTRTTSAATEETAAAAGTAGTAATAATPTTPTMTTPTQSREENTIDSLEAAFLWSPRTDATYWSPPASWYEEGDDDEPTSTSIPIRGTVEVVTAASRQAGREKEHRRFDRASALVTIADQIIHGTSPQRSPVEVVITVPHEALAADAPAEAVGTLPSGICVPAVTVRRLCCDAGIVPVVEDNAGRPLQVGRKVRKISAALMRVLAKRDQTCVFPGCSARVFLEGHHLQHWADGGETSLVNLCRLCSHHHRFVHEYDYSVRMEDDRLVFSSPAGREVPAVPTPMLTRTPDSVGEMPPTLYEVQAGLGIGDASRACLYDGSPVDYRELIDTLIRADGL